jgi:signal transduction histidine kinase/ActR/RegA family two-component response regulator
MVSRIQDIVRPIEALHPDVSVSAAFQRFQASPDLDTLAVGRDGRVIGIVLRHRLLDSILSPINPDVLFRQPVRRFMEKTFEAVEVNASISYVTSTSTTLKADDPVAALVAMDAGRYAGIVPLGRLLKAVSSVNLARARAMKGMRDKLDAAVEKMGRSKRDDNQFMALLGHEIRTPLTGILGVADLLSSTKLGKEQRALATTIVQSGHHLDRLLDDLLDLSRLKAGKVKLVPEAFDVGEFAREARSLWQARGKQADVALNVQVKTKGGKRIVADATRLRQILFNLVSNAIKFSGGGRVDVVLETKENSLGRLELKMRVSDTGPGISDADKARLFEMFEQASSQTRLVHGGSGLGLAIAKGLVDRMGGDIDLQDKASGGSVFTVICPVSKAAPRLVAQSQTRARSGQFELGRILIVDDHDTSRFVMSQALAAAGWQVDSVATAAQAERRLAGVSYQAAVFDLHLGDTNGGDLIAWLRSGLSVNRAIPVLAVSADVGAERRQACQVAGFDGFVEKPIRPRRLVAGLADLIVEKNSDVASAVRLRAV